MWDAIGIIGLLATVVAIVVTVVLAIKRNPVWKKWLAGVGIAFVLFVVGAINGDNGNTDKKDVPVQKQKQTIKDTIPSKKASQPISAQDKSPVKETQEKTTPEISNKTRGRFSCHEIAAMVK